MAQPVKHPTLDFCSGHDLFVGSSPASGSVLTVQSLPGILSLSLSLCPSPADSLKMNKLKKKKKKGKQEKAAAVCHSFLRVPEGTATQTQRNAKARCLPRMRAAQSATGCPHTAFQPPMPHCCSRTTDTQFLDLHTWAQSKTH